MENNIAVSVIVPIYNAEAYLEKCLDSIINQTLTNIEIILIDDGSRDSSAEICQKYVEADKRVSYYHKENEGLAAARQDGIERARGQYIGFVDSDDWLELNMYERMFQEAQKANADIVFCNCYQDDDIKNPVYLEPGIYMREQIEEKILSKTLAGISSKGANSVIRWCNWLRIYKLDLIHEHNIAFDRRFRRSQDLQLTFETTLHANVYVSICDEYLYHNRNTNNGQSLSRGYTENYWGLIRPLVDRLYSVIESNQREDLRDQMHLCTFFFANQGVLNECEKSSKSTKEKTSNLNTIYHDEAVKLAVQHIEQDKLNDNYKMVWKVLSGTNVLPVLYKYHLLKALLQFKRFIWYIIRKILNNKFVEPVYVKIRRVINKSYEPGK